jgi:hypothetical protein
LDESVDEAIAPEVLWSLVLFDVSVDCVLVEPVPATVDCERSVLEVEVLGVDDELVEDDVLGVVLATLWSCVRC